MQERINKFTNEIYFNDFEVLTPSGFKDFKGIGITKPFQEYEIHFQDPDFPPFICADTHIVILHDDLECYAKDLQPGDKIKSSTNIRGYLTLKFLRSYRIKTLT